MKIYEKYVRSTDNKHDLVGIVYAPDGDVKGMLQVAHGMTELISRYDGFMRFIAENGYVCFGFDMLGHGSTAVDDYELGFIAEENGDEILVRDTVEFAKAVWDDFPQVKYFLLGHSMGSFVSRMVASVYPDLLDGLIISGTGGKNPATGVALILIKLLSVFCGKKHKSKFIDNLAFGTYNDKTEKRTPYDWLTRDTDIVDWYSNNKYCTFKFTLSAMGDLVRLNKKSNSNGWYAGLRNNLPIFLISGDCDPVGDYGKGVDEVYGKLKKRNVSDVTEKLYHGCRHEILNEIDKQTVYSDILAWLNAHN